MSDTGLLASHCNSPTCSGAQTPIASTKSTSQPRYDKNAPRSSAQPPTTKPHRSNLTLFDWLLVFSWMDEHVGVRQDDIVNYFATREEGALIFTQSALSKKLSKRSELEARVASNPTALSGKRPRIVTCPDVERCLVLWVNHMLQRGEVVNGHMLRIVRGKFEEDQQVPEEQRLPAGGWVQSFCKAYGLKDHRRHGEAGSVDLEAVEQERARVSAICKKYHLRDILNFDESAFFP